MKLIRGLLAIVLFALVASPMAEEIDLRLPSGNEVSYSRYPAAGETLLLWFSSERGLGQAERQAAAELSRRGVEVWQFDLAQAFFLPQTPSSLDAIDARDMEAVLARAQASGRTLNVYATGRAAVPVLRGLAMSADVPANVLLMHPNFYARADALDGAEYLSFGSLSHVQILLLQPRRSAATPWVENQIEALRRMGARATLRMLARLREGFWVREDATDDEIAQAGRLSEYLLSWMRELL